LLNHFDSLIRCRTRLADPVYRGAKIVHHHLRTFCGHEFTDFPTNAIATTGHRGNFAFE